MIYNYMYCMYTHTERQDRLHESRQGGTEAAAEQLGELQALHNFLGNSQGILAETLVQWSCDGVLLVVWGYRTHQICDFTSTA